MVRRPFKGQGNDRKINHVRLDKMEYPESVEGKRVKKKEKNEKAKVKKKDKKNIVSCKVGKGNPLAKVNRGICKL